MLWVLAGILGELFLTSILSAQVSVDDQWLRLMHYQTGWNGDSQSSLSDPDFFLSPLGKNDPAAEWSAAKTALSQPQITLHGKPIDPQCAFPARTLYFQRLGLLQADQRSCPEFVAFRTLFNLQSMSLVFSTAYAGNSASMFGHTLLKLNRADSASGRGLLDYGVAFLALSDPTDGALYALKGLFGGYPGFYTIQPYYELVNQYAYSENRDLWELEIPLDSQQKELLIAHLWELRQEASAPYYFTHVNCASMLAELVDVVKPAWRIRASLHGFVMPSQVMREVADRVEPKVAPNFRPSQRRLWLDKLGRMDDKELADYRRAWADQSLDHIAPDIKVLDGLLDRVTIEKSSLNFEKQKPVRAFEQDLLRARSTFTTPSPELKISGDNNPIVAHGPALVGLTAGTYEDHAMYGLRLRAGWHDLLDKPEGFEPWYHLNYLNLALHQRMDENRLLDADLTLAEVWSLNPFRRDEHLYSWTMGGGLRYQDEHRSLYVRSSGGISAVVDRLLVSALPGVELSQDFTDAEPRAKVFLRLQTLARFTSDLRGLAIVEPNRDDKGLSLVDSSLELRANFTKSWQLHAKWERRNDEKSWELGVYWNP